jgi:hypothetical protein
MEAHQGHTRKNALPQHLGHFWNYFSPFLHGAIPAIWILFCDFVIKKIFDTFIDNKIRLTIFWLTTGNLQLGVFVGAVPIFKDISQWLLCDGPDPPPMVAASSLLHSIMYYLPTAFIFFNVLQWLDALGSAVPALALYFPTYLTYSSKVFEVTGIGKSAHLLKQWLLLEVLDPRIYSLLTVVLGYIGRRYEISISGPFCRVASLACPWIEPTCSRLPLAKILLLIFIPYIPAIIYGQTLKIHY